MDELGAVLDTPVDDIVVDDQAVTDDAAVVNEPILDAETKEDSATDWRKVPAELKEYFKTPGGKQAKDAWFERNAYKEIFSDGVKGAKEVVAFLEEHGGRDGLTTALGELQGKAAELDAISQKIESGDASLVSDLTPDTVSKLAPAVMDRWAKENPEGWGAAMSGVMANTLQQNGIPMFLERMGLALEFGKLEDVTKMVSQLKEWSGSFAAKAQAPAQKTVQPDAKFTEREQQLNQREEKVFYEDVERKISAERDQVINKELESYFKRRPNDSEARELAISTLKQQMGQILLKDQTLDKSVVAFAKAKNKDGASRLMISREAATIKDLAPKIGRLIFGNPAPAKAAVETPVAKKVQPISTPLTSKDKFDAIYSR